MFAAARPALRSAVTSGGGAVLLRSAAIAAASSGGVPALRGLVRAAPIAKTLVRACAARYMSTDRDIGGMAVDWPVTKMNTIVNICPQGQSMVVLRMGKLHSIEKPGMFFTIPFIDKIAYVIDVREKAIEIDPQKAITKDNVSVDLSGVVYVQFQDEEKAAFGSYQPFFAVIQHAQSAMRAAVGEMELDEILHRRNQLNKSITTAVGSAAEKWGINVLRYEVTEIKPDRHIAEAMDKQAAAERARREEVIRAEASKRSAELIAEGVRQKLIAEAEGRAQAQEREAIAKATAVKLAAEAEKVKRVAEAEGHAEAVRLQAAADSSRLALEAEGQAEALRALTAALEEGGEAAQRALAFKIAEDYTSMTGQIGAASNTMFFGDTAGGLPALAAQVAGVMKGLDVVSGTGTSCSTRGAPQVAGHPPAPRPSEDAS